MLLHQNHLFTFENLAGFGLPNGLCLEEEFPTTIPDGLALCAPDDSFVTEVCFVESTDDARAHLEDIFREDLYTVVEPIHAVTVNNVTGFAVTYETRRELDEEYAFDISSGGEEHILLNIWFMRRKNVEQNEELYASAKAELLGSITLLP